MWAFAAYFGAYLISFIVNGLLLSISDPRLKYLDHEFRFLFVFPIFLLLRHLKVPSGIFWHSITIGAIVAGGYAFCSHFLLPGEARIKGGYHSIAFGDLSLAMAFMSIASIDWYRNKHHAYLILPLAAFFSGLTASVMSGTRGAWIAAPVLLCVLFVYSGKYFKVGTRLLMVGAFCIVAVAAYHIPATNIAQRLDPIRAELEAYAQGQRHPTATSERIEGWKAALDIFLLNPIVGAGPGTFKPLVKAMVEEGTHHELAAIYSKPHSSYLSIMSDCGLLGLGALLALFGMPLWLAIKQIKTSRKVWDLGFAMVLLVVAFAQFAHTEAIFSRNVNISFYVIMVAALMAITANEKAAE